MLAPHRAAQPPHIQKGRISFALTVTWHCFYDVRSHALERSSQWNPGSFYKRRNKKTLQWSRMLLLYNHVSVVIIISLYKISCNCYDLGAAFCNNPCCNMIPHPMQRNGTESRNPRRCWVLQGQPSRRGLKILTKTGGSWFSPFCSSAMHRHNPRCHLWCRLSLQQTQDLPVPEPQIFSASEVPPIASIASPPSPSHPSTHPGVCVRKSPDFYPIKWTLMYISNAVVESIVLLCMSSFPCNFFL